MTLCVCEREREEGTVDHPELKASANCSKPEEATAGHYST